MVPFYLTEDISGPCIGAFLWEGLVGLQKSRLPCSQMVTWLGEREGIYNMSKWDQTHDLDTPHYSLTHPSPPRLGSQWSIKILVKFCVDTSLCFRPPGKVRNHISKNSIVPLGNYKVA